MQLILNIGLNTSPKFGQNMRTMQLGEVLQVVEIVFVKSKIICDSNQVKIHQGGTEDTLILRLLSDYFDVATVEIAIYRVALKLKQECIAYRLRDNDGGVISENLIGLYASAWGEFNSDFFYE